MNDRGRDLGVGGWGRPGLRVCLASLGPFVGGAEVAAERLAVGVREAGHEVCVVLGHRNEVFDRMRRAGLRCRHAPMSLTDRRRWWRCLGSWLRLLAVLRRERPDVVHANDLPTHQAVAPVARALGVPVVCHHRFPFDGPAIDWLNKFGADRHVFISESLMGEMTGLSATLAASPRSVVHDGLPLPPRPSEPDRARCRERLGLPSGKTVVLFAGQVIAVKGVADLIEAWSLLDREGSELVIVGDDFQNRGAYRSAMQDLAGRLGCPARFAGFQSEVGEWMTASDVVVVPSHVEPLGLVVMEAMAAARPVVGSDVGGIPEMLIPGRTGLLVPPRSPRALADALARLIADPGLRARLGDEGRRRCEERFGLDGHVRSIVGVYREVIEGRRG